MSDSRSSSVLSSAISHHSSATTKTSFSAFGSSASKSGSSNNQKNEFILTSENVPSLIHAFPNDLRPFHSLTRLRVLYEYHLQNILIGSNTSSSSPSKVKNVSFTSSPSSPQPYSPSSSSPNAKKKNSNSNEALRYQYYPGLERILNSSSSTTTDPLCSTFSYTTLESVAVSVCNGVKLFTSPTKKDNSDNFPTTTTTTKSSEKSEGEKSKEKETSEGNSPTTTSTATSTTTTKTPFSTIAKNRQLEKIKLQQLQLKHQKPKIRRVADWLLNKTAAENILQQNVIISKIEEEKDEEEFQEFLKQEIEKKKEEEQEEQENQLLQQQQKKLTTTTTSKPQQQQYKISSFHHQQIELKWKTRKQAEKNRRILLSSSQGGSSSNTSNEASGHITPFDNLEKVLRVSPFQSGCRNLAGLGLLAMVLAEHGEVVIARAACFLAPGGFSDMIDNSNNSENNNKNQEKDDEKNKSDTSSSYVIWKERTKNLLQIVENEKSLHRLTQPWRALSCHPVITSRHHHQQAGGGGNKTRFDLKKQLNTPISTTTNFSPSSASPSSPTTMARTRLRSATVAVAMSSSSPTFQNRKLSPGNSPSSPNKTSPKTNTSYNNYQQQQSSSSPLPSSSSSQSQSQSSLLLTTGKDLIKKLIPEELKKTNYGFSKSFDEMDDDDVSSAQNRNSGGGTSGASRFAYMYQKKHQVEQEHEHEKEEREKHQKQEEIKKNAATTKVLFEFQEDVVENLSSSEGENTTSSARRKSISPSQQHKSTKTFSHFIALDSYSIDSRPGFREPQNMEREKYSKFLLKRNEIPKSDRFILDSDFFQKQFLMQEEREKLSSSSSRQKQQPENQHNKKNSSSSSSISLTTIVSKRYFALCHDFGCIKPNRTFLSQQLSKRFQSMDEVTDIDLRGNFIGDRGLLPILELTRSDHYFSSSSSSSENSCCSSSSYCCSPTKNLHSLLLPSNGISDRGAELIAEWLLQKMLVFSSCDEKNKNSKNIKANFKPCQQHLVSRANTNTLQTFTIDLSDNKDISTGGALCFIRVLLKIRQVCEEENWYQNYHVDLLEAMNQSTTSSSTTTLNSNNNLLSLTHPSVSMRIVSDSTRKQLQQQLLGQGYLAPSTSTSAAATTTATKNLSSGQINNKKRRNEQQQQRIPQPLEGLDKGAFFSIETKQEAAEKELERQSTFRMLSSLRRQQSSFFISRSNNNNSEDDTFSPNNDENNNNIASAAAASTKAKRETIVVDRENTFGAFISSPTYSNHTDTPSENSIDVDDLYPGNNNNNNNKSRRSNSPIVDLENNNNSNLATTKQQQQQQQQEEEDLSFAAADPRFCLVHVNLRNTNVPAGLARRVLELGFI